MPRTRLTLERLEDRWCPAVTATLQNATLTISGAAVNGSIGVVQDATTAGTINVFDGATPVNATPFTGVKNIKFKLTAADDKVTVDLGGKTLAGDVNAGLGAGKNSLTVTNGGVGGNLGVAAGDGDDTVTLGGTGTLALKDVQLAVDGGIDTVSVKSGVTVSRSLAILFANNITLEAGSSVANVYIRGGSGGNTVTAAGAVTGDLAIDAFYGPSSTAGTTATVTGNISGNVFFAGSNKDDSLTISGSVGKNVTAFTDGGADTVSITGAVGRGLFLDTGSGNDQITIGNSVGGKVVVYAGSGDDTLTMVPATPTTTLKFADAVFIDMGAGNDKVTLDDAAVIVNMLINGGVGADVFVGTRTRTGLKLLSI